MRTSIEFIVWRDATSDDAWIPRNDILAIHHLVESVGFVAAETEDAVALSPAHDMTSDNFCCILHIPKCTIVKRVRIDSLQLGLLS